jgi:hypothetical protein
MKRSEPKTARDLKTGRSTPEILNLGTALVTGGKSNKPGLDKFLQEVVKTRQAESLLKRTAVVISNVSLLNHGRNFENYGRNFENYGRNFENYGRNFENYGRNFENYGRNFENYGRSVLESSIVDKSDLQINVESSLPNGQKIPINALAILARKIKP